MRIAVLITCYNRVQTTLECLRRVYEQVLPSDCSLDVWLVDDASPDGTADQVQSAYPQTHVIRTNGGLFWCKGMRLAWDTAAESFDYDFYLWLNDDSMLEPMAISWSLADYEKVRSVIVGTIATDETETAVDFSAVKKDGSRPFPNGVDPVACDGRLNGNFVLVPREVFKKIGPIYGGYRHGAGDGDYAMMLLKNKLPFYSSSHFCGWCQETRKRFYEVRGVSLRERWRLLMDPKGYNLHDTFVFRYRHWGLGRAIVSSCHVIYKALTTKTGLR